jgi:hypothetical protein
MIFSIKTTKYYEICSHCKKSHFFLLRLKIKHGELMQPTKYFGYKYSIEFFLFVAVF